MVQWRFKDALTEKIAHRQAFFWLGMALLASLPFLISPKQLRFYVVPSMVFYALAIGTWLAPYARVLQAQWHTKMPPFLQRMSTLVLVLGLLVCLGLSWQWRGKDARSSQWLQDARQVGQTMPTYSQLYVHPELYPRWELHGYFYRYFHIDLTATFNAQPYAMMPRHQTFEEPAYQLINDSLPTVRLYQRQID